MNPDEVVSRQVDAYNSRDLSKFVLCHHPEVELYNYPDSTPFAQGRSSVEERYKKVFDASPDLNSSIISRIIQDHIVIDKELIIGRAGREPFEMVAIYEVEDGLIRRARFIM